MISFQNLTKIFPPNRVIFNEFNLTVNRGELVLLTGDAGFGKSLLMRLIQRYEKPTRGQVIVFGQSLDKLNNKEIPFLRRRIGSISQEPKLMRPRTVSENLVIILDAIGIHGRSKELQVSQILKSFELDGYQDCFPSELSRSQQQKLMIARALVIQPSIILADEPLTSLDRKDSDLVTQLLLEENKKGSILIWSTRDPDLFPERPKKIIQFTKTGIELIEKSDSSQPVETRNNNP